MTRPDPTSGGFSPYRDPEPWAEFYDDFARRGTTALSVALAVHIGLFLALSPSFRMPDIPEEPDSIPVRIIAFDPTPAEPEPVPEPEVITPAIPTPAPPLRLKPRPEPKPEPAPKPVPQPATEPEPTPPPPPPPEPKPQPIPEPEPVPEPEPEPVITPPPDILATPTPEPLESAVPTPEPIPEPVPEPEPVQNPVPEPVIPDPIPEPVPEPEPILETPIEPVPEPVIDVQDPEPVPEPEPIQPEPEPVILDPEPVQPEPEPVIIEAPVNDAPVLETPSLLPEPETIEPVTDSPIISETPLSDTPAPGAAIETPEPILEPEPLTPPQPEPVLEPTPEPPVITPDPVPPTEVLPEPEEPEIISSAPTILASPEAPDSPEEIARAVPQSQAAPLFDPIRDTAPPGPGGGRPPGGLNGGNPVISGPAQGGGNPPSGTRRANPGASGWTLAPGSFGNSPGAGYDGLNLDIRCREAGRTHADCPEYLRRFKGRDASGFESFRPHANGGGSGSRGTPVRRRAPVSAGTDPWALGIGNNSVNGGGPSTTVLDDAGFNREFLNRPIGGAQPGRVRDLLTEPEPDPWNTPETLSPDTDKKGEDETPNWLLKDK